MRVHRQEGGLDIDLATGPSVAKDRVTLVVDDVVAIAERCWDAGFEVRLSGWADGGPIVLIGPFGLEVELIASGSQRLERAVAATEW